MPATDAGDDLGALSTFRQFFALEGDVLVLSVAMFAFSLGFQMTGRYMPRYLSVVGAGSVAIGLYGAVVAVVVVLPVVAMLVESVTAGGELSLRWYAFLVEQQTSGAVIGTRPLPAVRNSLLFGAGTLLVAVPMGVVVALATNRDSALSRLLGTAAMLRLRSRPESSDLAGGLG